MSAFMVSRAHVRYLVSAAEAYDVRLRGPVPHEPAAIVGLDFAPQYIAAREFPELLGQALECENVRSLLVRYPGDRDMIRTDPYTHETALQVKPVWVLKACDCYDYQACESPDYEQSFAARLVNQIRHAAVNALPGYDGAPWGIEEDSPGVRFGRSIFAVAR